MRNWGWTDRNVISTNFHLNYLFHKNLFDTQMSGWPLVSPVHTSTPAPAHNCLPEWSGLSLKPLQPCIGSTCMAGCSSFPCPSDLTHTSLSPEGEYLCFSLCPPRGSVCITQAHQMLLAWVLVSGNQTVWESGGESNLGPHTPCQDEDGSFGGKSRQFNLTNLYG